MPRLGTNFPELEQLLGAAGDQGDVLIRGLLSLALGVGQLLSLGWGGGVVKLGGTQPKAPAVSVHS